MTLTNDLWNNVAFSPDDYESWRRVHSGAVLDRRRGDDDSSGTSVRGREGATLASTRGAGPR